MPDPSSSRTTLHASCVALGDSGVLILGAPGAGKSDLVLGLIDQPGFGIGNALIRARLVSDDQTIIERRGEALYALSPKPIAGLLEIRGQGIVAVDHVPEVKLALVVRLMPATEIERLPENTQINRIAGLALPEIAIDPATVTAPARIRAALTGLRQDRLRQIPRRGA
jgi:serine kinase of HPr protein (carbohydrate metabolism regulator)